MHSVAKPLDMSKKISTLSGVLPYIQLLQNLGKFWTVFNSDKRITMQVRTIIDTHRYTIHSNITCCWRCLHIPWMTMLWVRRPTSGAMEPPSPHQGAEPSNVEAGSAVVKSEGSRKWLITWSCWRGSDNDSRPTNITTRIMNNHYYEVAIQKVVQC